MQKSSIFYFLLPVLLSLAFKSECKAMGSTKLNVDFHHAAVYSMPAGHQSAALISPCHNSIAGATTQGIAFQLCSHSEGNPNALKGWSILPPGVSGTADGFSQQDKYLSGIYPSHNFW